MTKKSFLNAYAWHMICASSFTWPQNQRRDHSLALWLPVFYVKIAGRANSYDLEIPGGDISCIYFLRLSFSMYLFNVSPNSKVDFGDVSVLRGKLHSCRTAQTKRETNRGCHWKIQIRSFWISLYGLFIFYCFQIICHFQMRTLV